MKQSKRLSRLGCGLNNSQNLPKRQPEPTGIEKENYLNKRRIVATKAGLECCPCGGMYFKLSDDRCICGDCGKIK